MQKDIIIMAKSWKKGGYCVAGIDNQTGEWIRIISNDAAKQHAVTEDDMKYEDGTSPHVLDIVRIKCIAHTPNDYQPENYTMDSSYYWERIGRADINDVIDLHPSEIHGILFYNTEKRVHPDEISSIRTGNKYSLALIKPSNTVIRVKRWDDEHPKVTAIFTHMGRRYWFIKVTDPVFAKRYQTFEDGDYPVEGVLFVVSLADPNPDDGHHWKLVATVLHE